MEISAVPHFTLGLTIRASLRCRSTQSFWRLLAWTASRRRIVSAGFLCHLTELFSHDRVIRMWMGQIARSALCLVFLCPPILSFSGEIQKIDSAEYRRKYAAQEAACASKGMPSHFGFCTSREHGRVIHDDPTQISIVIGQQIASFEYFYTNCEHSDFSYASDVLAKAKRVFDVEKFYDETKAQKEALENHVGRFKYCKTKTENDAAVLNDLRWFENMIGRYSARTSGGDGSVGNFVTSSNSTEYSAGIGNERLSLICNGSAMVGTDCLIKVGSSRGTQSLRFIAQPTRYSHLLRKGIEKALAADQPNRRLNAIDVPLLRDLALDQCHPAAESRGVSGDLLQLCIPADSSRVVLFMRGLCDRCDFEPVVLEKQVSQ